jgi:phage terminase small subunit
MGRGGARLGAGRKPSKLRQYSQPIRQFEPVVHAGGLAPEIKPATPQGEVTAEPPEDLPADQRDFWLRYAGLAIEKKTLTPHTVAGFRLLCEQDAEKRVLKETIDRDGRTFIKVTVDGAGQEHQELKAHPLTSALGRTTKHLEALMARFGLAPFGKAELPVQRKAAINPWAEVGQK